MDVVANESRAITDEMYHQCLRENVCPRCAIEDGQRGFLVPNGSAHCFVCRVCGTPYGNCQD